MPVTPIVYDYPALASLIDRIEAGALPEYALVGWDAPLWFLGDTIPLFGGLASAGDLLMAAGMFLLIFDLLRQNPPGAKWAASLRRRPINCLRQNLYCSLLLLIFTSTIPVRQGE